MVIRTNGDGKYILISPTAEKGFVLLGNGKAYYFGDLDIQGKLTVRGKEVIPGQMAVHLAEEKHLVGILMN